LVPFPSARGVASGMNGLTFLGNLEEPSIRNACLGGTKYR